MTDQWLEDHLDAEVHANLMGFLQQWHLAGDDEDALERLLEERKRRAASRIWRSKDGRETDYEDLERDHLLNILMFLRRTTKEHIEVMTQEDGVKVEWAEAWENNKPPEWEGLMEEAKTRGGMIAIAAHHIEEGMDEDMLRGNVL
jgi:hypothetical protein